MLLVQIAYQSADLDLAVSSLEKAAAIVPQDRALAQRLDQWRREAALHSRFETRSTERFKVSFEGAAEKAIGDRIAVILESAYWRIGKTMSTYPSETLNVILYTNRQFQDITRAPAWAGGGYDGRIRLPVNGALRSPKTLERVVTHEFVHAVIHNAAGESVPTWVNEGLASYLESSDRAWVADALRRADGRIDIEDLVERLRPVRFGDGPGRLRGEPGRRSAALRTARPEPGPVPSDVGQRAHRRPGTQHE